MIELIKGILLNKGPGSIIVDTGNIGYKVYISLNTYNELPDLNKKVFLYTHYNVTEKSQDLYGFKDNLEKDLFRMLISVSGIGPKIAINLLSFVQPNDFKQRLISGEVKLLTSLPGIGPKTAKRIIIELKDKFVTSDKNDLSIENDNIEDKDAYSALISLGFKANEIKNALIKINKENIEISTQDKIKQALKILR